MHPIGYARRIVGYVGGLFSPMFLNPLQWLYALSSPSTVLDKTANLLHANLVDSAALTFLASGEYVTLESPITFPGDFTLSMQMIGGAGGANSGLTGQAGSTDFITISSANVVSFRANSGTTYTLNSIHDIRDGEPHTIDISRVGSTIYYTVDSGTPESFSASTDAFDISLIGSRTTAAGFGFDGSMFGMRLEDSSQSFGYSFAEDSGLDVYDTGVAGNHGTITTADIDTMRATKQSCCHPNPFNGHSKVLSFSAPTSVGIVPNSADFSGSDWTLTRRFVICDTIDTDYAMFAQADGTGIGQTWLKINSADNKFKTTLGGGGNIDLNAPAVAASTEYEVSLAHDATANEITLTVNGTTYAAVSVTMESATGDLYIGASKTVAKVFCGLDVSTTLTGAIDCESRNAYGTTMPNTLGENCALTDTPFAHIPALDDGSDDVLGLGLTNPPCTGNAIGNNSETLSIQEASYAAQLGHSGLWFEEDGVTPKKVSWGDAYEWNSFKDNTVVRFQTVDGFCMWTDSLIWEQSYIWTLTTYLPIRNWIGDVCGASPLAPAYDSEGKLKADDVGNMKLYQPSE